MLQDKKTYFTRLFTSAFPLFNDTSSVIFTHYFPLLTFHTLCRVTINQLYNKIENFMERQEWGQNSKYSLYEKK